MWRLYWIWAAVVLMFVQIPLAFVVAPEAANFAAPLTQRILYYHVGSAWVAFLAFAVTAYASYEQLRRAPAWADALARASAEVGTAFASIALLTGLLWSRVEFLNYRPLEDPKLISLVILVFAYLAYFVLRASLDDPARRKRVAAVYGLLAVLGVPLSYLASRVSIHPDFSRPDQTLAPVLWAVLLASALAFTVLYVALVALRHDQARLEERLHDLEVS